MAFDVVVIGSGSAGAAVAAGLAERSQVSVLLLEAGPADRDPRIRIPAASSELWFGKLDWAYETEPQLGLDGRRDTWPRGRVLGGSSSINATMYVRGMPEDFDGWAAAGATGWDAAAMLEAFRRIEDDERGPAPHRGGGGPLRIERQRDPRPVTHAFLDACEELGLPRVDDYHLDPDGCALTMVTQRNGRRWSAADAYLRQAGSGRHPRTGRRSNLTVVSGADVQRVVVEDGRAVGVEVLVGGRKRFARATHEVIVSAGAIGSPHLLLRSGIGPADDLRDLGVEVVADLPGVGSGLQDHLVAGVMAGTAGGSLYGADRDPRAMARWLRRGRGPLTSSIGEAIGFLRTTEGDPAPDIELIAIPAVMRDHARIRLPRHGITIGSILLRPRSRGKVRLASADPSAPPIVDPGSLGDPEGDDLRRLTEGVRFAQRLLTETGSLGGIVEELIDPEQRLTSDADVAAYIRRTAQTLYHPAGTCRMGSDDWSVVDPDLRVRGVDGLRVVDASVMPTLVRGHTHAPTVAIGDRAARLIAADLDAPVG